MKIVKVKILPADRNIRLSIMLMLPMFFESSGEVELKRGLEAWLTPNLSIGVSLIPLSYVRQEGSCGMNDTQYAVHFYSLGGAIAVFRHPAQDLLLWKAANTCILYIILRSIGQSSGYQCVDEESAHAFAC